MLEMMSCGLEGYGVWEWGMGMMDKGYGGIGIKLEYYPQMCIGDGFIFN